MKTKLIIVFIYAFIVLLPLQVRSEAADVKPALQAEALTIVKKFGGTLKPLLKEAVESGGLDHAVNVCSVQAPRIAKQLSSETGWNIKRVSLKPRNSKSAGADDWEKKVLQQFNERQSNGEAPAQISYAEIVNKQFRFMKAQGTEAMCLNCHGANINPDVASTIKQHYPDDQATGYTLGQIRGAFSLSKDL